MVSVASKKKIVKEQVAFSNIFFYPYNNHQGMMIDQNDIPPLSPASQIGNETKKKERKTHKKKRVIIASTTFTRRPLSKELRKEKTRKTPI